MNYNTALVTIIDDSPEDCETYQRYLMHDGWINYDLQIASSARSGLQLCQERWPDLILLDFLLPDLNGNKFIDALKQLAGGRTLPAIVVLTGQGNEDIAVMLMKKGVADYLNKNKLTESSFQASIRRILTQSQLQNLLEIQQQHQRALSEVALRVRQSLALADVLNTAVAEVKKFLQCDRVVVYQFRPDGLGDIVAEAVGSQWRAALRAEIIDTCFQQPTHKFKYRNGYRLVVDNIHASGLSECHINLLAEFQVKSVLVVPIIQSSDNAADLPRLWGLLIAHQCQRVRSWQDTEVQFLEQLSVQLAIAIYQAELVERLNRELIKREQIEQDLRSLTQAQAESIGKLGQTTKQLEQRNQDLDSFVAVASHDLRAPLRAIGNLSTWLAEDAAGELSSTNQQQLGLLKSRVEQMEALLSDLLEYAKIGRLSGRETTFNVGELVNEILQGLKIPAEFEVEIGTLPTLQTDRTALEQVLTNLISNALKHHPRQDGKLAISATQDGELYRFAVEDDGAGIEPQHHQRIFEIFKTFSRVQRADSTGIGLAIVKKIVESRGGTISIDSEVDKGTTFSFTWPLAIDAASAAQTELMPIL